MKRLLLAVVLLIVSQFSFGYTETITPTITQTKTRTVTRTITPTATPTLSPTMVFYVGVTSDSTSITINDTYTYTLTLRAGTEGCYAENVVMWETIPASMLYAGADVTPEPTARANNMYHWTVATVGLTPVPIKVYQYTTTNVPRNITSVANVKQYSGTIASSIFYQKYVVATATPNVVVATPVVSYLSTNIDGSKTCVNLRWNKSVSLSSYNIIYELGVGDSIYNLTNLDDYGISDNYFYFTMCDIPYEATQAIRLTTNVVNAENQSVIQIPSNVINISPKQSPTP